MSELFVWSDALCTGVASVDAQHEQLVALVNRMHVALREGRAEEAVGPVLDALVDYTASHFAHEEELMRRYGYPGFDAHKSEHDALIDRVLRLQRRSQEDTARVNVQVMVFLKSWLKKHILGSDKAFGPFLTSKGAA